MTNIFQKTFLGLTLAVTVFMPQVALAQTPAATQSSCEELRSHFPNSNITANINDLPKYCNVESVYIKVINISLYAIGAVAVIMIIYGGYMYMTARGNEEQAKKGRSILIWAILGLVVVLAAAALVNAVVKLVVEN
jgi:hypothetical protein